MVTVALELAGRLLEQAGDRELLFFASRERPPGLETAPVRFVLSPHRHEVANKLLWFPAVEAQAGLAGILYPYWPCPPRRRRATGPVPGGGS